MFPLPSLLPPVRLFLAASPTAAAPPAARLGPGPLPCSPAAAARLHHAEAEVRVAVRQEAAEKRNARGFFFFLHTSIYTLDGHHRAGPGFTRKRLLTCHFTPAPPRPGSAQTHSFKGRVRGAVEAGGGGGHGETHCQGRL